MTVFSFTKTPEGSATQDPKSLTQAVRQMGVVLNRALSGKLNATGEITLTSSAGSTTLTDARLTIGSFIDFDPMDANAAAEKAAGTIYVTEGNRRNGVFTVTHANNGLTRKFKYLILG